MCALAGRKAERLARLPAGNDRDTDYPLDGRAQRIAHRDAQLRRSALHEADGVLGRERPLAFDRKRTADGEGIERQPLVDQRHRAGLYGNGVALGGNGTRVALMVGTHDGGAGSRGNLHLDRSGHLVAIRGTDYGERGTVLPLEHDDARARFGVVDADRAGIAELRRQDGKRGGDRARRVVVEKVLPVAGGVRLAAEVDYALHACGELGGPRAENEARLQDAALERLAAVHAPHGDARRALVVPDEINAARLGVGDCLGRAFVFAVVDREYVDALADTSAEHVEAEVARPESARKHRVRLRIHLAELLSADFAEALVVGSRVGALVSGGDLVEPLDAEDALAELLRYRADRLAPSRVVERVRLESGRVDMGRQHPLGRTDEHEPRLDAVLLLAVHRTGKPVELVFAAVRDEPTPADEHAVHGEAELRGRLAFEVGMEVRRAERRAPSAERLVYVGNDAEERVDQLVTRAPFREEAAEPLADGA